MRVSGPAARELWALLEINWICEEPRSQEPVQVGRA